MWPKFSIQMERGRDPLRDRGAQSDHRCTGVRSAELDGTQVDPKAIPLLEDGKTHDVVVESARLDTRACLGVQRRAAIGVAVMD